MGWKIVVTWDIFVFYSFYPTFPHSEEGDRSFRVAWLQVLGAEERGEDLWGVWVSEGGGPTLSLGSWWRLLGLLLPHSFSVHIPDQHWGLGQKWLCGVPAGLKSRKWGSWPQEQLAPSAPAQGSKYQALALSEDVFALCMMLVDQKPQIGTEIEFWNYCSELVWRKINTGDVFPGSWICKLTLGCVVGSIYFRNVISRGGYEVKWYPV